MIYKVSNTAPVSDPMTSTKTEKRYSISWPKASLVDVIPAKKNEYHVVSLEVSRDILSVLRWPVAVIVRWVSLVCCGLFLPNSSPKQFTHKSESQEQ